MPEPIVVLRAIHILFAILWAGAAVYATRIHMPLTSGPDRSYAVHFYGRGAHDAWMGLAATGTLAFGGVLLIVNDGAYASEVIGMGGAALMGLGMTAAMVAYGVGILGHARNGRKLRDDARAIGRGDSSVEARFDALRQKDARLSVVSAGLVGVAMLCMVSFRFFA